MYAGLTNIVKSPTGYNDNEVDDQLEQDAFASGRAIAAAVPKVSNDHGENTLAPAVQAAIIGKGQQAQGSCEQKGIHQFERLAGWQAFPDWPGQAPQHNLRDSHIETTPYSAKAYRGFGNSPTSSTSASRKSSLHSSGQHRQPSKKRAEKVILVPTDAYTPPPERARPAGLQAFLESSEEGETETESDSETDSDDNADEVKANSQPQEDESDTDEEISTSEEDESEDEEDARAPLVRIDN